MLHVEDLVVSYGAVEALHGVSLSVGDGEIVTLVGANGAGKSTLLRAVSGMVAPRSGRVRLGGEDVTGRPAHVLVARGVAHVPEGRRIFTSLTVRENLELGAYSVRSKADAAARLERVLALFPRLSERIGQSGGTLSGGEQQMLAIGRALMAGPRLLLLDEPSLGLAPLLVQEIFREIARIHREEGTSVLLVEQNANLALALASRGYVLETGRIVLSGAGRALLDDPQVRAAYLGHA
jgi:branched-chain amino acid transport system ATP-binding protein